MLTTREVEDLFARMVARYGSGWMSKFDGVPIEAVKQDWAETLHDITRAGIDWGLQNLPPRFPPDAMQFRMSCLGMPHDDRDAPKRLGHSVNRTGLTRIATLLHRVVEAQRKRHPRQWADELRAIPEALRSPGQAQALRNLEASPPPLEADLDAQRLADLKVQTERRVRAYKKSHPEVRK